jgi:hypothetical protein
VAAPALTLRSPFRGPRSTSAGSKEILGGICFLFGAFRLA